MAAGMKHTKELLLWILVAAAGGWMIASATPRLFPLLPPEWEISRSEAAAIAHERFAEMGDPVIDPYMVIQLRHDLQLERRLQLEAARFAPEVLLQSRLALVQMVWEVVVYPPGADPGEWAYKAWISRGGEVLSVRRRGRGEAAGRTADDELRSAARQFLVLQGIDPLDFDELPTVHREDLGHNAGVRVRFLSREAALGTEFPYGVEVFLDGEDACGFSPWYEDPRREDVEQLFRSNQLVAMGRLVFFYFLLPVVGIPFLQRYHDGELGVRRGAQLAALSLTAGIVFAALNSSIFAQGSNLGFLNREQTTWLVAGFLVVFQVMGVAILGLMSWSVGESLCRRRWGQKLASFDAFCRFDWRNAAVAQSTTRGFSIGLALVGVLVTLATFGQGFGAWAVSGFVYGDGIDGPLPAVSVLAGTTGLGLPIFLFVYLLVPCWTMKYLGSVPGLLVSLLVAVLVAPRLLVLPFGWGWAMYAVVAAVPVLVFRWGDLLSALTCGFTLHAVLEVFPTFFAADSWVASQGWAVLVVTAAPALVSLRFFDGDRKLSYVWDDIPPHVRRIAERERQRVEIETARNIQSSILPSLPPQLQGVEIAHAYLPASEVGGDFYDVLALDDGCLALAVGDVAGHGVSSGLVMSMAKSALAVQVTFDPAVESVFTTLNRMVYQSARRRLLSTLCYAVLSPDRKELVYASAGHVFPYRISSDGEVQALVSESYPLGVRDRLEVRVRNQPLAAGDTLFFYSDGLVEATPEGDDSPFGFDRLQQSLVRYAGRCPADVRDGVLDEVERFTGRRDREDDLTVLVLRLPAA